MSELRTRRGDPQATSSIWDELVKDPIMEQSEATLIQRSFPRTLLGVLNDYFVGLIIVNVLVSLQVFVGVVLGVALSALLQVGGLAFIVLVVAAGGIFGAPAFAGLFCYILSACDPDTRTTLRDYLQGMRRFARRSWLLLLLQLGSGFLLFINLRFYSSLHGTVVALPLMTLILLISLLWAMAGFYVWPLLVRGLGWRVMLRNAFYISMASPFSTIGLLVALSALSAVLIASRVLWLLFAFAAWALVENVALQRLVRIFRERQQALEASESESAG